MIFDHRVYTARPNRLNDFLKLYEDVGAYIFTWLVGYGSLLAAFGAVMVVDYWLIRRTVLDVADLYDPTERGRYWFSGGFNPLACVRSLGPARRARPIGPATARVYPSQEPRRRLKPASACLPLDPDERAPLRPFASLVRRSFHLLLRPFASLLRLSFHLLLSWLVLPWT